MDSIYLDGLGNLSVLNGMVRCELVTYEEPEQGEKTPGRTATHRLVMTPQTFIGMVGALNETVKKMEEAGLITRKPAEEPPPAE